MKLAKCIKNKFLRKNKGFTISELVVVFAIVIIVGVLLYPFIKYANTKKNVIICSNNLRKQGLALYIYALEHEGMFPPSLKTLYDEKYLSDKKLMDCPASKATGTPESPDYIYNAGLSVKSSSQTPLVQDLPKNHPTNSKNVLYVNGSVSWEE
ncbi:MAG: prepilin-type N-terminal cleavage/methylation domain-containing protein [Candidatus Omnitrophota bacterium]